MKPTILVTGGAGYIGSHISFLLSKQGYNVIILDTLVHGQPWQHSWATLIEADYADTAVLQELFKNNRICAVIHCAAFIEVAESVANPISYYHNNVTKTLTLLEVMQQHNVNNLIFSS